MKYNEISVFLPAYNEEKNIKEAVISTRDFIKSTFNNYEIIVVDDGSRDKTAGIVRNLIRKDRNIKLVSHKKNIGFGGAIRTGLKNSKNQLIFYMDSDNQFNIADFKRVFPLIDKYDIVSAYRVKRKDPLSRIIISNVYNALIELLFSPNIRDIDASFKLYKKNVIDRLNLKSKTGLIDTEIFVKARKLGFTIGQIGVSHNPRTMGKSIYEVGVRNNFVALIRPKVVFDIFKEIKELWTELR